MLLFPGFSRRGVRGVFSDKAFSGGTGAFPAFDLAAATMPWAEEQNYSAAFACLLEVGLTDRSEPEESFLWQQWARWIGGRVIPWDPGDRKTLLGSLEGPKLSVSLRHWRDLLGVDGRYAPPWPH